jgi:hypothetical protein
MSEVSNLTDIAISVTQQLNDFLSKDYSVSIVKYATGLAPTGAVLIALLGAFTLGRHRSSQRYAWDSQRLLYLHGFLTQPAQFEMRRDLRGKRDVTCWGTQEDRHAELISAAYNEAGILLLAPGLVNSKQTKYLLRSTWGTSICELYDLILKREKIVKGTEAEKSHGLENYFTHFGELCKLTQKYKSQRWPGGTWNPLNWFSVVPSRIVPAIAKPSAVPAPSAPPSPPSPQTDRRLG